MFDYCQTVYPESLPCSKEAFESIINDATVKHNCQQIRLLVEATPPDACEEVLKEIKKKINRWKSGSREEGIPSLPGFCFHASFTDNHRSNTSATPSGLVSIDLDKITAPAREFFESLREKALQERLCLAYISPSTRGLKLVFPVPEGATDIESAQEMIVARLGVAAYLDSQTFDLARLAFASPAEYILYRNDELLFGNNALPDSWGKETADADQIALPVGSYVPKEKADQNFIDGIRMSDIIDRLAMKVCGKTEPEVSERNNTLFRVTKLMRVYCDDNVEKLFEVMPRWGLDNEEWERTIRSACSRQIAQTTRQEAEAVLLQLRREQAIERGATVWSLPEPPEDLPPVFKEYARVTPKELLPAQLMSLCSILGFYGTMSKANYSDPDEEEKWCTPSFITVITAPSASGKDNITNTYRRLTERQRQREVPLLNQLNAYNISKKKEMEPKEAIRLLPERLSMTSLSLQMEKARGKHVFIFTPEIDTLKTSNGSGGWADLSTVFRKAIDNDMMGQIYMSGESHCCNVPIYLNMLILAQQETMQKFFNRENIINGLVSRVLFVELPDNTGCRKTKVKRMSDFERRNVEKVITYLENIGQVVKEAEYDEEGNLVSPAETERQILNIPRSRKALQAWGIAHQNHYLQTQDNPAEDHFFRRAARLGFHAAMVAYMCSGCHETKAVIDFALWVAEFCLQSQLLHFGAVYNDIHKRRDNKRIDQILAINSVSQFNLLDALPSEFTTQDMQDIMRAQGRSLTNPSVTIKRWKRAGLVRELPYQSQTKKWVKA